MRLGRSSSEDDCECWFTPAHFLEALERERQWFEMLMLARGSVLAPALRTNARRALPLVAELSNAR